VQREGPFAEAPPQTMGEAPVKYELTGASCHLRTEARVCGVDQLNAYWDSLAIGCAVFFGLSFFRHRRVIGN
jgi:hypothetical protein